MARKKMAVDPGVQERLTGLASVLLDGDAPDWSALDSFSLGELVSLLGALDAGVMVRSSERGSARSIGVFVGGQSQWTTCRDQRELLAMLEATVATLQDILGSRIAPAPVSPGKPAKRASGKA